MPESILSFHSSYDPDLISSIVSSFGEDVTFFSSQPFRKLLLNHETVFLYLSSDQIVLSYCLFASKNRIAQTHHFKTRSPSHGPFFFFFVSHIFSFGRNFSVPFFRFSFNFPLTSPDINSFISQQFSYYERFFMSLPLNSFASAQGTSFQEYYVSTNISQFIPAIINLMMVSAQGSLDAILYPEYSDFSALRSIFGLSNPDKHFYSEKASVLLFHDQKLIGINLITLSGDSSAVVWQLSIHPEYRRQGLGYKLMSYSILTLKEMGRSSLTLNVTSGNPAKSLYESLGFLTQNNSFFVLIKNY